jgi:hypothetical protein
MITFRTDVSKLTDESYSTGKYVNIKNEAQCVEFVRQTSGAPHTSLWRKGIQVKGNDHKIPFGTAIAIFNENGRYPQKDEKVPRHAAIYIGQNISNLVVLDQWVSQNKVLARPIWFADYKKPSKDQNNGDLYYVIITGDDKEIENV